MSSGVLVVGAGPVGLTTAAELARFGVKVRLVDKSAGRTDKSKAIVIWSRTLELLERAGCSDAFVRAGFKAGAANIIAGSKRIARVSLGELNTPFPFALMIPQSDSERLLEEHLLSLGVRVERQVELIRFGEDADGVSAVLRHADGREENAAYSWLVGCDGAHSTIRHGLGMQFEGDTMPSDWILADLHIDGLKTRPDELCIFWHADGVLALFPLQPPRYRLIADVGDVKSTGPRTDPTLAEIQAIVNDRGPGGIVASDPIWLSPFRINERKVADYSTGRIFLAGDAAHVHSPAGGQGMNTGMQDAFNLAWKLAMVDRSLAAAEPLLASYSLERSAVGDKILRDTGRMTTVAILCSGILQEIRNHVASLAFGLPIVREKMADNLAELSIGYPRSPLTVPGKHHGRPAAGDRMPPTNAANPVGSGSTPRFVLFADASAAGVISRYPNLLEPTLRPPLADNTAHLVRPDGYVATVASSGDLNGIDEYLKKLSPA